jgi:DNA-binding transcriptional regulator/RsmH inhibitor MraZ
LRYAEIQEKRSVVIVGMEDHFEIWVKESFDKMAEQCMEEINQLLRRNIAQ